MTLQRRLFLGISLGLAVIMLFFGLTTIFFRSSDRFVADDLSPNLNIASLYERLEDYWTDAGDEIRGNVLNESFSGPLLPEGKWEKINEITGELGKLVILPAERTRLLEIESVLGSYSRQLQVLERTISQRMVLTSRERQKHSQGAEMLAKKATELTEGFTRMMEDFSNALREPEFRSGLATTSALMSKISRIEKDLLIANGDVSLYIAQRRLYPVSGAKASERASLLNRILKRLQAVVFLLEKSLDDSKTPVHTRILTGIRKRIQDFRGSLQTLGDELERVDSERLEIDDLVSGLWEEVEKIRVKGLAMVHTESVFFWMKISTSSATLMSRTRAYFRYSIVILTLSLIGGLYLLFFFPRTVGKPLGRLLRAVKGYQFGEEFEVLPQTRIPEIDSIGEAFHKMAGMLKTQGMLQMGYLKTILEFDKINRTLVMTSSESPQESLNRLEKTINDILNQLVENCPQIDLVKVMRRSGSKGGEFLERLGDPQFNERFRGSPEFSAYCSSTGWSEDGSSTQPERIGLSEPLSGWYFENQLGFGSSYEEKSFFQPAFRVSPILENPVLRNRKFEQGLGGCLYCEALRSNTPDSDGDDPGNSGAIGMLFVYFQSPSTFLSGQDVYFIQIMSSLVAIAVETAGLLEEKEEKTRLRYHLQMAGEIQENLLPKAFPDFPGLRISRAWKPAAEVGGDFYDFFPLDDRRLAILVADASGKNVPAAMIMTVFKTTLSTLDLSSMDAGEVLTRANVILQKNITSDRFITAMYVIIDSETGKVALGCAGHLPAIVVSGKGVELAIHEKALPEIPMGILDHRYSQTEFTLNRGDLLVIFTDGVTEARNPDGEEYEMGRLKRFLSRPRGLAPAEDLLEDVTGFAADAPQHDDITLVTVEFLGRKK